jgi:hypothetical protein
LFVDLLALEPVAQQIAALHDELLALGALLGGEFGVVVLQREASEGDMACLVLHDVGEELLDQRVGRHVAEEAEGGERQAFDEYLHTEVGEVPAGVLQRLGLSSLARSWLIG